VLLLHSLAGHSHWWDWTAPLLAERHHVVALDLRGHGGSDWVESASYQTADYAGDVRALLSVLGYQSTVVIGHSLGGSVGLSFAALHPEQVDALVIADMMTHWTDVETRWAARAVERPEPEFTSRMEAAARYRLRPPETSAPAEWIYHLGETALKERRPGIWQYAFDRRVFAQARPDVWPILPRVQCPTLVVRGSKSTIMDETSSAQVALSVPRGRSVEVEGAYHHLILDDPARFVFTVDAWLAG
jgi:pimeloyl-ACP methyl ester carboxylesterase